MIEKTKIEHAMLHLGASINVIPLYLYTSLQLGLVKETQVIIQVAIMSNA